MASSVCKTVIFLLLAASSTIALQVSPGSPCSSVCLDNANASPNDANNSNTVSADIVCNDADYNSTAVGTKFQACLSCLQTSGFSSGTESDQSWFLYNLRFAVDWCLFGFPNNPSPLLSGPCMMASTCGGLAPALETGNLNPDNGSTYDYCSASGGAFLSNSLGACTSCLPQEQSLTYIANFIIALQAGCNQRPSVGLAIGLVGTLFSSTPLLMTTPFKPANSGSSSGLSTGAKIGIAVAAIVITLIASGVIFIFIKKRKAKCPLNSSYDPRFGATEITAPNKGAYTNPQQSPTKPLPPYEVPIPKQYIPHLPSSTSQTQVIGNSYPMEKYTHSPTTTAPARTPTTTTGLIPSPVSLAHSSRRRSSRRHSSSTTFSVSSSTSSPQQSPGILHNQTTPTAALIPVHAAYIPAPGQPVQPISPTYSTAPPSPPVARYPSPPPNLYAYGPPRSLSAMGHASNTTPSATAQAPVRSPSLASQAAGRSASALGQAGGMRSFPDRMRSTRAGNVGRRREERSGREGEEEAERGRERPTERDSGEVEQWPGSY